MNNVLLRMRHKILHRGIDGSKVVHVLGDGLQINIDANESWKARGFRAVQDPETRRLTSGQLGQILEGFRPKCFVNSRIVKTLDYSECAVMYRHHGPGGARSQGYNKQETSSDVSCQGANYSPSALKSSD